MRHWQRRRRSDGDTGGDRKGRGDGNDCGDAGGDRNDAAMAAAAAAMVRWRTAVPPVHTKIQKLSANIVYCWHGGFVSGKFPRFFFFRVHFGAPWVQNLM